MSVPVETAESSGPSSTLIIERREVTHGVGQTAYRSEKAIAVGSW
jgi:hypothetical protein